MTIKLYEYPNKKFAIGIEVDTPTKSNPTMLLVYNEIPEKRFIDYMDILSDFEATNDALTIEIKEDGRNTIYIIKEKYITR